MGAGAELRDFGNAFAAASRGRWKSKADREQQALELESARLRLEALKRAAADYPEDRAIQKQKDDLELEYARMRNAAAKKAVKEEGAGDPANDPDFHPGGGGGSPPVIGPGSSMDAPGPFLGGGGNDDLMNQAGESAKSYVSPVTGTFANKSSNRYLAARSGGKRLHSGVDLNAANGSTVVAPIAGTVVSVGYDPGGYDHYVVLLGADGYAQRIANHGKVTVRRGDTVNAGDPLGVVGRGHVHWEIVAPGSSAYKALAGGGRASTQSHRGVYPTVDLSGFFDLQYGSHIVAGQPLGTGGTAVAARGIPRPGMPGGAGGDQLNDIPADASYENNPEMPGSRAHEYEFIKGGGLRKAPLVSEDERGAGGIPSPTGAPATGTSASTLAADIARATGRTGHAAEELPTGVTVNAVAPTSMGARDKPTGPTSLSSDGAPATGVSASTLPHIAERTIVDYSGRGGGRGLAGTGAYSNEGGSAGSRYGGRGLTKLNAEDRQAVLDVSSQLGIAPSHLLSVIGYETIGTYNPDITSPTGYMGLIQFGPNEQKKFGVKKGMSFSAQLRGPVVDYLKSRGLKPGMGLPELYSIINAGSLRKDGTPRWGAHDANGDLRHHLTLISKNYAPGAMAWLGGTQLDTTSAVDYAGKVVPTPNLRPKAGIPSANTNIPPSSGLGTDPLSPNIPPRSGLGMDPLAPANPATRPTISPISSMQMGGGFGGGFQMATGRMGAIGQNLELPRPFPMARGGVVPSNNDIARATGRTGQLAMELPSDAPTASSIEDRRGQPPVTPPHDYGSDYSPGDGYDTQRGPDVNFDPGGETPVGPLEPDGYDPNGSVIDAGHHAVKTAIEKDLNAYPTDELSGSEGTNVTNYGGGAGGDVVDNSEGGDGGDVPVPASPDAGAGDTGDTPGPAIPAPGLKWDELPALKKTDPDIAKYIEEQEKAIDPDGNMPVTQRHIYALGLIYRHFRDVKHNPLAAERVAREITNYWAQQFNMYQAVAEEAINSGDMDAGVEAAIKAWNYIPDNRKIEVDKEHHGFKVTYTDNAGKTVVEQTLSPQEVAAKILGMNPKTFYEQIAAAGGGHLPSKAFSAVLEKLDRTGKLSADDRAKVHDPGELDYLVKHWGALNKGAAGEAAKDTAAAAAARREADKTGLKKVNSADLTAEELGAMTDAGRDTAKTIMSKRAGETAKAGDTATVQKAQGEYAANKAVDPDTWASMTKEAQTTFTNWRAEQDALAKRGEEAAGSARAAAEFDVKEQDRIKKEQGPLKTFTPDQVRDMSDQIEKSFGKLAVEGQTKDSDTVLAAYLPKQKVQIKAAVYHALEYNELQPDEATAFINDAIQPTSTVTFQREGGKDSKSPNYILTDPTTNTTIRLPEASARQLAVIRESARANATKTATTTPAAPTGKIDEGPRVGAGPPGSGVPPIGMGAPGDNPSMYFPP